MELDDLKTAWAQLEQRTAAIEALVIREQQARQLRKSRRALSGLSWGTSIEIVVWIGIVAIVAPFWIEHRHVPHLLLAGLVLHIYGVSTIVASVVQLLLIGRMYCTAPVVVYQRRLAELRRFRVVCTVALILPWWVLWIPAIIVAAKKLTGIDLYAHAPGWIHANLAFGVVAMAVSVWAARRIAERPAKSPRLNRIIDDLAGRSLARATRRVNEVAQFERE